jgi:hypothetical protein
LPVTPLAIVQALCAWYLITSKTPVRKATAMLGSTSILINIAVAVVAFCLGVVLTKLLNSWRNKRRSAQAATLLTEAKQIIHDGLAPAARLGDAHYSWTLIFLSDVIAVLESGNPEKVLPLAERILAALKATETQLLLYEQAARKSASQTAQFS